MAHGGKEFGLRPICRLCHVTRVLQVAGAVSNLMLEVLTMRLQAIIALTNFAQHLIEAVHKLADFAVLGLGHLQVIPVCLANGRHGPHKVEDGRCDVSLQPQRYQNTNKQCKCASASSEQYCVQELPPQIRDTADQCEFTDALTSMDHRDLRLDSAAGQQIEDRYRLVFL